MRNILIILAALVGFGAFAQTNIPTRIMLVDSNGVVKMPTNITRIRIGGTDYTNLLGFGLSVTNGQLSVDTTQLPEGSGGSSLITSVGIDFDVSGGALNVTNTIGTGPLVRQSEAGSGGGGTNFINAVSADFEVLTQSLSLTNTTGTGALLRASSLSPYLLSATAASTYATLESPSFTGIVSFDTISASTVELPFASAYASANSSSNLVGTFEGSGWTNLNGTEIRSGTVAEARIDPAVARLASPAFTGSPTAPTASPGTSNTVLATTAFVLQNGGGGGDVTQSGNNTFTGTNSFSGTTTFNDLAIGMITVVSNLTVPNNAYGAGWNGSTNVPNENSVYDEMELRAPKASPSFTGVATNTGSFGAPTLYVGSTNVAVALASFSSSDTNWNGNPIASGTITNLTTTRINSLDYYNLQNGDFWAEGFHAGNTFHSFAPLLYGTPLASGSFSDVTSTTNNPFVAILTSSTTTNSGFSFDSGNIKARDIGGGNDEFVAILSLAATNRIEANWGFIDVFTGPDSNDGAYFRLNNGYIQGVLAKSASYTRTATSNLVSVAPTVYHRYVLRTSSDRSYVTFWDLTPSGSGYVTNWTDSITNTLPTGTGELTGIGVVAINKATPSAINLIQLDAVGVRSLRILSR